MNIHLKKFFSDFYESGRLSHAFLICNTNLNNLKEDLISILSDYFFDYEINNLENSDIYIIEPTNDKIVKEDILTLQENFKTKSQLNSNRIYIIDGAEKMNEHAANSLLKTLEEPEKGIYAFLISENINKVLPTIKSRCQVIMLNSGSTFNLSNYEAEQIDQAITFVKTLEKYKVKAIPYIYDFINKKEDRNNVKNLIKITKYFYRDVLNYKLDKNIEYFVSYKEEINTISSNNDIEKLVNKLIVLNKSENMLEYNLNINLFFDKLVFEMEA